MFKKTAAPVTGGYTIAKSLRYRASASANTTRTPGSTTNRKTYTWSGWVKRGSLGSNQSLFSCYFAANDNSTFHLSFVSTDTLNVGLQSVYALVTSQVFRDPSAWYHIVCAVDTTQATANDRIKLYVNGSQITSFSTNNISGYVAQNFDTAINTNNAHYHSYLNGLGWYFDGYMTEVNFIDGQQLTPSSFGSFSGTGGVWQPKKYTGTYGTNGFYLKFTDTTSTTTLCYDYSGNSNNWTPNNLSLTAGSTYDSMTDVPTLTSATVANYCVLNPLDKNNGTVSNANLAFTDAGADGWDNVRGSMGATSGKFYWEVSPTNTGSATFCSAIASLKYQLGYLPGQSSNYGVTYYPDGNLFKDTGYVAGWGSSYAAGDVIGIALDMDNGKVFFAKNNTWQASGNPVTGANPASSSLLTYDTTWLPIMATYYSGGAGTINFGQQPFTYTPPTGYKALNTYNLATPTITQGNLYMDATIYTGTGSNATITNTSSFKPDFVWIKGRTGATNHYLYDSIRGANVQLLSNATNAEANVANRMTAFNSNGFSIGSDSEVNQNTYAYVGWNWQAGQATITSNNSGNIASNVCVSTTAGFSVVTYTGTGSSGTVGHGLGVTPTFLIYKARSSGTWNWLVNVGALTGSQGDYVYLNSTQGSLPSGNVLNANSNTFPVLASPENNENGTTFVAYCWAPISGFSAFGKYTGNGSSDGPFIYTGFRPKFFMVKDVSTSQSWGIFDSSRDTYNAEYKLLIPNNANAEDTGSASIVSNDFLSNGIKLRGSWTGFNQNGDTYVYMAFAENPFKYALAR